LSGREARGLGVRRLGTLLDFWTPLPKSQSGDRSPHSKARPDRNMSKSSRVLLVLIVALALGAAAALSVCARPDARHDEHARQFHRLVGGLGFGPAVDLARCEFAFDPRLCPACSEDTGPIPGGMFFCPYHASSVFDYPPLK